MTAQPVEATNRLFVLALWVTISSLALLVFWEAPTLTARFRLPALETLTASGASVDAFTLNEHPIQKVVGDAQTKFEKQLAKQSTTYELAASEYHRRYHRDPPPGFKEWYEYAVRHESAIIDDFDIINQSLAPLWRLSGEELRRRLDDIRDNGPAIVNCRSSGGQLDDACGILDDGLLDLLRDLEISTHLPDLEIPINGLDEPRVVPMDHDGQLGQMDHTGTLTWENRQHQNVWDVITAECDSDIVANAKQALTAKQTAEVIDFSLSGTDPGELDLCRHPEYDRMHGFWRSPTSFEYTNETVPILSPAVLSTMGDIPYPAAAYTHSSYTYDESEDMPYANKTPAAYWAGKTTGSFQLGHHPDWKLHHRQRFVALIENIEPRQHVYLARHQEGAAWTKYNSSYLQKSSYKVHFTDVVQCEDDVTCDEIRNYFQLHENDPRSENFKYTLAFDVDGNGHSGRYYRLLNSRSLPLKQTVFREWHDDRL